MKCIPGFRRLLENFRVVRRNGIVVVIEVKR